MRTIWKFPLSVGRWRSIPVGPGPVVLAAIDPASGAPAVWIMHERAEISPIPATAPADALIERETRLFGVFGTGEEIDPEDTHVGSMIDRGYVWHVFERAR